jgi:membrane protein DedA with SNARE-associated domain
MDWIQNIWISLQNGQLPQLGWWSYLLLAVLVAVEGPLATLLGAAAASAGLMRPYLVFAASAAGNLTADSLWYTLGYAGRIEWILRYGRRLGVRRSHLDRLKSEMHKHGTKILLFAKLTSGFIIPSLIAAGLARIPWRRWFPVILSAEMVWTGSLVVIGYYATEGIKQIEKGISYIALAASAAFLLVVIWGVRRTLRKRSETKEDADVEITEIQG